jgi:predicted glutamine amidotransferase
MWGMVSNAAPGGVLEEHLSEFRNFGASNPNGWAIGYFFNEKSPCDLYWPVVRRGGPRATEDPDYGIAVSEVMDQAPRALIAHVRYATSGHSDVPNPHPFAETEWLFSHNGTIDRNTLITLIGPEYLADHEPDFTNPYIDSELYFIYLLKTIEEWPEDRSSIESVTAVEDAISYAVSELDAALDAGGHSSQLTFLLTNGETLWGCRYADVSPSYYTLYYSWPLPGYNWTVSSEPVSNDNWTLIPMYHVLTFEPGMRILYTEIPHV